MNIDFSGIALVVAALGGIVTTFMQFQSNKKTALVETKVDAVHILANSNLTKAEALVAETKGAKDAVVKQNTELTRTVADMQRDMAGMIKLVTALQAQAPQPASPGPVGPTGPQGPVGPALAQALSPVPAAPIAVVVENTVPVPVTEVKGTS